MSHDNEYDESMVTMLQLIWGEGYMAPGGAGNVARMLDGMQTRGKRILDIGCGIGGPAFEMARVHGADVVGIDLESPLVARANARAADLGLAEKCTFMTVEPGPLPFDDQGFDIVATSGAITQTADKRAIFRECYRVLQPGGYLTCYDWTRSEAEDSGDIEYSDDMLYWFKMEGLTYALETLPEYRQHLIECGYTDVSVVDASEWYRKQSRQEYELIKGDLNARMVELLGQDQADWFVEDWRALAIVCEKGELRQGYCRGRRPD